MIPRFLEAFPLVLGAIPLVLAAPPQASASSDLAGGPRRSWVVGSDVVYTAAGEPIRNGQVTIGDGVVGSVGAAGAGDPDLFAAAVTPGLVDLGAWMNDGAVEHSTEMPLTLRAAETLDLYAESWGRELRSGVTSLLVAASDMSVIGGPCALVKTGGKPALEARTVRADCCLRGSIGVRASWFNHPANRFRVPDHFVRRPTTRMGVEWVWRKAFYDALAAERDPSRDFAGADLLRAVVAGEMPLMIGAAATQDIRTAVFLKREFEIPRLIVQNAAEAWKDPELLVGSGADVVLPPMTWGGRIDTDNAFHAWNTAALLHERGVRVALSGNGAAAYEERLALQPGFAMRGGLPFDAALAAVTIEPARMVGADGRVGSLEAGKDADLVLWSGTPFEPTSRVVGVILSGELVVDPRQPARR